MREQQQGIFVFYLLYYLAPYSPCSTTVVVLAVTSKERPWEKKYDKRKIFLLSKLGFQEHAATKFAFLLSVLSLLGCKYEHSCEIAQQRIINKCETCSQRTKVKTKKKKKKQLTTYTIKGRNTVKCIFSPVYLASSDSTMF